jgi:hypothetical protein
MTKRSRARLRRPIDATLHGATDYMVGAALTTLFPRLAGISGTPAGTQVRAAGAIHAAYSALTSYPLGIVKAIPYKAHLAIDALGAVALATTPFATGQFRKGRSQWVPQLALSAFELVSLMLSDPTGRGDYKADLETVRAKNMEDPHRKIHDPVRAVTPGAANGRPRAGAEAR